MNPGKRLTAAAETVRPGKRVVDVGTDHAYLPAYLILDGKTPHCLAVDIGAGPLENARKTVEKYALSDRIVLRISDGLHAVAPEEAEDITICGMGGTLMTKILSECKWLKKQDLHLVLQPQSHVWEVRTFLLLNGFCIDNETVLEDAGKLYITISAFYDGQEREADNGFCYFGTLLQKNDTLTCAYAENLYRQLCIRLQALQNANVCNDESAWLQNCLAFYEKNKN
ncbi:MAG: SAM-dependent methyltransferase [Clostridia bacterium]|nr:SAM-dependent methyltransferase [Clostridia bacterium]